MLRAINAFLDRPDIRKIIGVDSSLTGNFTTCNMAVNARFNRVGDSMFPTELYLGALLERGVRVLVYVGENDWGCNWVRNSFLCCSVQNC